MEKIRTAGATLRDEIESFAVGASHPRRFEAQGIGPAKAAHSQTKRGRDSESTCLAKLPVWKVGKSCGNGCGREGCPSRRPYRFFGSLPAARSWRGLRPSFRRTVALF